MDASQQLVASEKRQDHVDAVLERFSSLAKNRPRPPAGRLGPVAAS